MNIAKATVLLVAGVFVATSGYFSYHYLFKRNDIVFVIPNDFKGFIQVVKAEDGEDFSQSGATFDIYVPPSGISKIPDLKPFRSTHTSKARYVNGGTLSVVILGSDIVNENCFWVLNTPPADKVYFFVGTHEEVFRFLEEHRNEIYKLDVNLR